MINLIKNEWMKIFKRPGTYVMIGILLAIVCIFGAIEKYEVKGNNSSPDNRWEQNLKQENNALKQQAKSAQTKTEKDFYKQKIVINEYRLKHNIPPDATTYHIWDFVNDAGGLIQLAGLFTIIISAGIVASEFNWGTIKLLLIRPISRVMILLSKYVTVLLFALLMLSILFVFATVVGAFLFGFPEQTSSYLNYVNGKVTEQNMVLHLMIYYGLNSINMIMLTTMAFMISSVFRNSSLAIGISIFLLLTGAQITTLLAIKFSWAKYLLFANTDLTQYFEGTPVVDGMTLGFSIIMLLLYFLVFQALAFSVFKKRDVAA
ncbi:MAG: ABC transporter permease [Bacillota bacterium]|nr:ABC transporter permease [Bacillota bacterium]